MLQEIDTLTLRVSVAHRGVPRGRAYFMDGDRPIPSVDGSYLQNIPTVIFDSVEAIGALTERCLNKGMSIVNDDTVRNT